MNPPIPASKLDDEMSYAYEGLLVLEAILLNLKDLRLIPLIEQIQEPKVMNELTRRCLLQVKQACELIRPSEVVFVNNLRYGHEVKL